MTPYPRTTDQGTTDRGTTDDLEARLVAGPASGSGSELTLAMERFRQAAEDEGLVEVFYATVDSPVGKLIVVGTGRGVIALSWERDVVLNRVSAAVSPRLIEAPARLDDVRRQLDEYFERRRRTFEVPIDWSLTSGFRQAVLHELVKVPFGEVVTYGGLAERAGHKNASRAVGSAMATNPIPIIVPCHRVLRAGGALGGYSGRDGLVTKRYLLELEGSLLPLA